jgi:PAS domain S-box-containing protein
MRKTARRRPPGRSRPWLAAVFEHALDAILLIDDDGRHVDANPAALRLLGYTRAELLGLTVRDVTAPGYESEARAALETFSSAGRYAGMYRLRRKDGSVLEAEVRSVSNIVPGLHLGIVRDVTDRIRAEGALSRSRRMLEDAEAVAHIGSWERDLATNEVSWSSGMYHLFGVAAGGGPRDYAAAMKLLHPEDRAFIDELNDRAVREGTGFDFEARALHPDGEPRYVHVRGQVVSGGAGSAPRLIGIVHDVTEQRRSEVARQALLQKLITVHEEERARVSRELHDGPAQALAALLVGLVRAADAPTLPAMRLAMARQRELVAQVLEELGRIARGLRPAALDDLGLRAALERHAAEQGRRFGVEVAVHARGLGRSRLPRALETALYRVAQEALANAARHSAARAVAITLERSNGDVRLTVKDNGRGFNVARALREKRPLGLHGIYERAELVGGRAEIHSGPAAGTTVSVVVPVPVPARRGARA